MKTWLIAHTNPNGKTGAAQAKVRANTAQDAEREFKALHPNRTVTTIHEQGKE